MSTKKYSLGPALGEPQLYPETDRGDLFTLLSRAHRTGVPIAGAKYLHVNTSRKYGQGAREAGRIEGGCARGG